MKSISEPTSGESNATSAPAVVLDTVWEADAYTVYYGEDADEDGMPDQSFEVRYGEVYNAVNVPELSEYEEFCGYRLGDDLVFDENGKPVGTWKWTVEQVMS